MGDVAQLAQKLNNKPRLKQVKQVQMNGVAGQSNRLSINSLITVGLSLLFK